MPVVHNYSFSFHQSNKYETSLRKILNILNVLIKEKNMNQNSEESQPSNLVESCKNNNCGNEKNVTFSMSHIDRKYASTNTTTFNLFITFLAKILNIFAIRSCVKLH